ncbi:MAG: hypothetical protein DRP45_03440 [Candidatus Zixiibacteriota bacterium]|nr:MAG: hypothetical protein DRP45_03440 [candidate division Zixibacteria bacterium]
MDQTSNNAITQLERMLLNILKEEFSFYQSLYILMDKQRDLIRYDKEESLLDLYAEIERCQRRIKESETRVTALQKKDARLFRLAAIHPEVRKLINSIATLIKKNMALAEDNNELLTNRHERIKNELDELRSSKKILQYMSEPEPTPQYVDGKS